jgi:glucose-1-phosphatase
MKALDGIKNVIFDFGGVIINIDFNRTVNEFKNLGFTNFDQIFSQMKQTDLFDKLDKGLIPASAFRTEVNRLRAEGPIPNKQFDAAWNAMILELPTENLQLLERLKTQYRTFLFSNTNEIHYAYFSQYLKATHNIESMSPFFEKDYYSHIAHCRKPDAETYLYLLKQNQLIAQETLFLDDSLQNVEAAISLGIRAVQIKHIAHIHDIFKE